MMNISHNILMPHNLTQICIYPIRNPKPLLHPLVLQFLIKDMLELGLVGRLPKDLIRGRSPRDERSDCFPDLSFGITEVRPHDRHDRLSPIQPCHQLVLFRDRVRVKSDGAVEADILWEDHGKVKFGYAEAKRVDRSLDCMAS